MPSTHDVGAAGRARGFETRLARICGHYGITREKYLSLTDTQKVEYRIKFGTANPYKHKDGKPVKRTQLTQSPDEVRAEAQAVAVMAAREDLSEEDFLRWKNALPRYWKNKGAGGGKTQYTKGEVALLADAVAGELRKNRLTFIPEAGDRTGLSFLLAALRDGMKCLPRSRRRTIVGRQHMGTPLERAIKLALRREAKKAPPEPIQLQPAPAPAEVISLPTPPSLAPEQVIDHAEPASHLLKDVPNEVLLATLLGRLFKGLERAREPAPDPRISQLETQLKEQQEYQDMMVTELNELRNRFTQFAAGAAQMTMTPIVQAFPEPITHNVRVAIMGCLKVQFDRIVRNAEELKLPVNIQFIHIDSEKAPHPFSADYCICMQWLSHKWQEQVRRVVPSRDRHPFLSGGESTAVRQLLTWFGGEASGAQG